MRRLRFLPILAAIVLAALAQNVTPPTFRFIILGDRTGEAQPGVWEAVWKQAAAEKPDFIVGVGDTIQGNDDATADAEWRQARQIMAPYRSIPLYLAPGNHDVWSPASETLFAKYAGHPLHYSFDRGPAHFTILDNSRADALSAEEMAFLEADLEEHKLQPLKFVVSHRPSWLVEAALHNTLGEFPRLAHKYGVQYVVAGHVHELLHIDVDGISYFCAPSAGGHLRDSMKYENGWFFGYTLVTVQGTEVSFQIKELGPPHGEGRVTSLSDWELDGLKHR
jgi:predicted phosphodiesterase